MLRSLKVLQLPATPEPNVFYYVKNNGYADAYVTDKDGAVYPVTNVQMITQLIGLISTEQDDPGDVTLMFDNALI